MVSALKPKCILEIGTQEGASAHAMALAQRNCDLKVDITCIDPFLPCGDNHGDETYAVWEKNVAPFRDGVTIIKAVSSVALPQINRQFEIIFVDGSHDYEDVVYDLGESRRRLAPGGVIIAHDTLYYADSVGRACQEFISQLGCQYFSVPQRNFRNDLCGWIAMWDFQTPA